LPFTLQSARPDLDNVLSDFSDQLLEQKAILRGHMMELRSEAAARDPDAPERLAARFPIKLFQRYGPVVSGYVAIGDELDPGPLLARLQAQGATIVYPRVERGATADQPMTFHAAAPALFEPGPFSLSQPKAGAPQVRPSLVLAPLLAFDLRGTRLGYGKGHYDRTMAHLRSQGRVFYLGLGYAQQQADAVPAAKHDIPLDWVETPLSSLPLFLGRAMAR
jgi:5-formyltetrahydrofolate cyclo-ligase